MTTFPSWDGVGTILATAAIGYLGFTVIQVLPVATADESSVTAVASPPPPAPVPTAPASAGVPSPPPATLGATAPSRASSPGASDRPAATPPAGGLASVLPSQDAERGPTPSSSPGAEPAASPAGAAAPKQQVEIKHAVRADRQLAALVLGTWQATTWFGGTWVTPVADYHLTARFGDAGSLWASTHTGLDFAAPSGTPVRAATAGTVTSVGWSGAYGNKIEISHPDGSETWYAHLSRTDVQVLSEVETGTVIGAVGATGNVTGPHLHFEVRPGGESPVDPEAVLEDHGVRP